MRQALCDILSEAGKELLKARSFSVSEKEGHANYVTDVDKRLQDMLMEKLHALCPEARFIGEERTNQKLTAEPTWVVDPIDGTTNFIHDYHCSVISAALLVDRVPQVGCICQPYLHEVYSAERGKGALKGGYVLDDCEGTPDCILIASGSEVGLAVDAKKKLAEEGMKVRVVSMPCMDIFEQQSAEYKESVLPKSVRKRVGIEALSDFGWGKYVGLDGAVIAMKGFGASGPYSKLFEHFGFQSGRDCNKIVGDGILRSDNGVSFLGMYINSFMSLKVEQTVDLDTHSMFICSVTEARVITDVETMTYTYYQNNVKPKPETDGKKGWVCKVCGYVYEGEDLPDDFICPLCKHGVADFEPIE